MLVRTKRVHGSTAAAAGQRPRRGIGGGIASARAFRYGFGMRCPIPAAWAAGAAAFDGGSGAAWFGRAEREIKRDFLEADARTQALPEELRQALRGAQARLRAAAARRRRW